MKLLKYILALVLSLAIPLAASSAIATEMAMSRCSTHDAAGMAATGDSGCCDNAKADDHDSKPSSPCESGQLCKVCTASYLPLPSIVSMSSVPATAHVFVTEHAASIYSRDLSGLWRPPRFL